MLLLLLLLFVATIIKRYVERFQVAEAIARAEVVECLRMRILCCIKASLVHDGASHSYYTHSPPPLGKPPPARCASLAYFKASFLFCVCQSALNYSVKKCETLSRSGSGPALLLHSCDPVVNKHCATWTDMACKGFSGAGAGSGSESGDLCL